MIAALDWDLGWRSFGWWAFLFVIWIWLRRSVGYKGHVTTFTIFFPLLLISNGVLVPLSSTINEQMIGLELRTFDTYWLALGLLYATIPVGVMLANRLHGRARAVAGEHEFLRDVENTTAVTMYLFIIVGICAVSLAQIYLSGLGFNMLAYFSGQMSQAEYEAHRFAFGETTQRVEYYLLGKLPYGLAPVAIVIVWNWKPVSVWIKCMFVGLIAFTVLQSGHKQPLVFIPALLILSWLMFNSKFTIGRRELSQMLIVFVLFAGIVLPVSYILQGQETLAEGLAWGIYRVMYEPQRCLQLFFEVYPDQRNFLYGASSRVIAWAGGVEDYMPPSVYIPRELLGLGETSFPALFIGDAWADFGYVGVLSYSVFVGFLLQSYNNWFYSSRRHPLEQSATFVAIMLAVTHLLENNLLTSLLTFGTLSSFLIYLLIRQPRRRSLSGARGLEVAGQWTR